MGFSWSLAVAQSVNECHAAQGPGLELAPPMADRRGPAVLREGAAAAHYVYMDDLGVISAGRDAGAAGFAGARESFERAGLALHDRLEEPNAMESLGVELDAERRETRLAVARYWRLGAGLRWLLARRK
eukprot:4548633-Pyramimonas_sp.AAC.1